MKRPASNERGEGFEGWTRGMNGDEMGKEGVVGKERVMHGAGMDCREVLQDVDRLHVDWCVRVESVCVCALRRDEDKGRCSATY